MNALRHVGAYGAIAATCAAINMAVLIGGDAVGLHYLISIALSFALCVIVGYVLHSRYTFEVETNGRGLRRYAAAMSVNLPATLIAVWVFYDLAALPMPIAAPLSTLVLTAINYGFIRWSMLGRVSP